MFIKVICKYILDKQNLHQIYIFRIYIKFVYNLYKMQMKFM